MTSLTLRWVEGAESVTWLSCPADLLVVLQVRLGEVVEVLRADPTGGGRLPRIAHPDDPDLQARYEVRAGADLDAVRLTDLQAAVALLAALGDTGGGVTRASYGMEVADRDVARFAAAVNDARLLLDLPDADAAALVGVVVECDWQRRG